MTVSSSLSTETFDCNGSTTVFTCPFRVLEASEVVGYLITVATNASVQLVNGADFSVTGVGAANAIVTTTATYSNAYQVNFRRRTLRLQLTDYRDNDPFPAESHEDALDRLTHIVQEHDTDIGRALLAPEPETGITLPPAATRASRLLGFDSSGNPAAVAPASGSAADLALSLASSSSSSVGTGLIGWLRNLTGAVATTLYRRLNWQNVNTFEFYTSAQVSDVESYTGSLDVTTPTQAAWNRASAAKRDVILNAGLYQTTGLLIPGDPAVFQDATSARRISGQGFGNPFGRTFTGGTIIRSTVDAPVLQDISAGVATINGTTEIDHLRIEGNTTTNIVLLRSSQYGVSSFHHNMVYQEGTGNGLSIAYGATASVHDSYVLNRDWLGTPTLGASRVGTGYQFAQNYDSGLSSFYKLTARGFLNGYVFGGGAGRIYSGSLRDSEVSACYNGIVLGNVNRFTVEHIYMEGLEGGIGLSDAGEYTLATGVFIFPGFGVGIESLGGTYGNVYTHCAVNNGSVPNSIGMRIVSSSVGGGPGKTVTGNHFGFSGSGGTLAGVVGLQLEGVDPRINWYGNSFEPRGKWIGGAGTKKINDISTSSDGTTGTGIYGLGTSESLDGSIEAPHLGRGSINLKLDPTALNNTHMSGTVLTIGQLSRFRLTPTSAIASITQITAPNLPDKSFSIRVTPTAFGVTFTHGGLLKLAGSANLVIAGGSNGATITFDVDPGGVCWERSRTVY